MYYQLAILDDDPVSIFSALLDKNLQFEGCLLLHSAAQNKQAQSLVKEYASFAINIVLCELPKSSQSDALSFFFQQLFDDYKNRCIPLWVNASCGARLHTLVAASVAQAYQQRVFVVESKTNMLAWLYPANLPAYSLTDRIKLKNFLNLHEITLSQTSQVQSVSPSLRDLGASWCASVESNLTALARLNWLAQTANNQHISEPLSRSLLNDVQLLGLIDDLEALQMVSWQGNSQLCFSDDDSRFFANGGWLELHVLGLVKGLTKSVPTIQDYGHSLVVERTIKGQHLKNEIDVAALENNRLHVIECKTKRFDSHDADTAIFKLDALTEVLGGVDAKGLLVSFHHIQPRQIARAKEIGIDIISGHEIMQLKSHLSSWFKNI